MPGKGRDRQLNTVLRRTCRDCRAALLPQHMWLCSDCVNKRIERIREGHKR